MRCFLPLLLFWGTNAFASTIIAIGDLHGDITNTKIALRLATLIDKNDNWAGGDKILVQMGDLMDRGDYERELVDLFDKLEKQAPECGGKVYQLNGNHDLYNIALDFKEITEKGYRDFAEFYSDAVNDPEILKLPLVQRGRAMAFKPGGPYAMKMSQHFSILKLENNVFVHAGLLPRYVEYGIDKINEEVSSWIGGKSSMPDFIYDKAGPFQSRTFAKDDSESCNILQEVLSSMNATRMIIGHTQYKEGINVGCNEKVWRIDTGISYVFGGVIQVLKIENGVGVQVIK